MRVGAVAIVAATLVTLCLDPAVAEVCDKAVGDDWRREHGAPSLLNPIGFPIGLAVIAIVVFLAWLSSFRWVAFALATILAVPTAFGLINQFIEGGEVYELAVREGCFSRTAELTNLAIYGITMIVLVLIGWTKARRPQTADRHGL